MSEARVIKRRESEAAMSEPDGTMWYEGPAIRDDWNPTDDQVLILRRHMYVDEHGEWQWRPLGYGRGRKGQPLSHLRVDDE